MTATLVQRAPAPPASLDAAPTPPLPAWVDAAPLTPRERAAVAAVCAYRHRHKVGPTLADVGDALGVSRVTVYGMVHRAARKGVLLIDRGAARSLRLANGPEPADAMAGEAARLRAENAALRACAAAAMGVMRRYAALYDGDRRAGPREAAVIGRAEMRRLAGRVETILKPGGPGNTTAGTGGGRGE